MPKLIALFAAMFVLAGCSSLVPSERAQSASVKATEALATQQSLTIRRALDSGVERGLTVAPNNQIVSSPLPLHEQLEIVSTATSNAGSHSTDIGTSIVSIPLGVKLILLAIGLGMLLVIVWLARHSSVAVNSAYQAGDAALGNVISRASTVISTTTNPEHKSILTSLMADLEKERGKLNAS